MVTIIGTTLEVITPADAERMVMEWAYPGQRKLRPERINYYADKKVAGDWNEGEVLSVVCCQGRAYIVNGLHRLYATIRSGRTFRYQIFRREADTMDEVAEIYRHYDTHSVRTAGDAIKSSGIAETLGLSWGLVSRIAPGLMFMRSDFSERRKVTDSDLVIVAVSRYGKAIQEYARLIHNRPTVMHDAMLRSSTVSVAMATLHYAIYDEQYKAEDRAEQALDFWTEVVAGDGLKIGDPRRLVREHLMTTSLNRDVSARGGNFVTRGYQARYIANAWNAWVLGRPLNQSRVPDPDAPIKLLGTPWVPKEPPKDKEPSKEKDVVAVVYRL